MTTVFGNFVSKSRLDPVFLGAFAELQKAAIIFLVCFRPSVRMEQLRAHWKVFHET
jgi:hypothetical protein